MSDGAAVMQREQRGARAEKRRAIARLAWLYAFLLVISTITLGVFVVAFIASLKDDALREPTKLSIEQLRPANWASAWRLGAQGGHSALLGGIEPGARLTLTFTYANTDSSELREPVINLPRLRRLDSDEHHSLHSDIRIGTPIQIGGDVEEVSYDEVSGTLVTPRVGVSRTWQVAIEHAGTERVYDRLPLVVEAPKGQVLINSDLPPARIERRGRVSSWDNIVPGAAGYVFSNYVRVIDDSRSLDTGESLFLIWTGSSFFIAILKVLLTLIIACTGGYALARFQFPGSRLLMMALLLSLMIPGQVLFISNYLIYRDIGLLNTPWAVITAVVASAQVLIMKQFFESIPREVEEAAIVDGASPAAILTRIFLPMSMPAVASVTILGFQGAWNDFFWPLVVLTSPAEAYTLPVGLLSMRNAYGIAGDWGLILAGSFLSVIPVLIIFILFQRYFVESDTSSAVKG